MVESVRVIEFLGQPPGERGGIGHAEATKGFEHRKLRKRHLQAEQLMGE
jgi:hypothetical protein